jgi:hypothetical protein
MDEELTGSKNHNIYNNSTYPVSDREHRKRAAIVWNGPRLVPVVYITECTLTNWVPLTNGINDHEFTKRSWNSHCVLRLLHEDNPVKGEPLNENAEDHDENEQVSNDEEENDEDDDEDYNDDDENDGDDD